MYLYAQWLGIAIALGVMASGILYAALRLEHARDVNPSQIALVGGGSAGAYLATLVISNLLWSLESVSSQSEYEYRILMILGYAFCAKFASFLAGLHYLFRYTITHSLVLALVTILTEVIVLALFGWMFGV